MVHVAIYQPLLHQEHGAPQTSLWWYAEISSDSHLPPDHTAWDRETKRSQLHNITAKATTIGILLSNYH